MVKIKFQGIYGKFVRYPGCRTTNTRYTFHSGGVSITNTQENSNANS